MRTNTHKREVNGDHQRTSRSIISTKTPKEPKIINLAVHLEKLTAQLNDGRELSIPIN